MREGGKGVYVCVRARLCVSLYVRGFSRGFEYTMAAVCNVFW